MRAWLGVLREVLSAVLVGQVPEEHAEVALPGHRAAERVSGQVVADIGIA